MPIKTKLTLLRVFCYLTLFFLLVNCASKYIPNNSYCNRAQRPFILKKTDEFLVSESLLNYLHLNAQIYKELGCGKTRSSIGFH